MKERGNKKLRLLDRYIGIPLIFCLGLLKRKKQMPKKVRSIALLKTSGIGDTVLLSAIIYDLKAAYPDVSITLFTGRLNFEMGNLCGGCNVIALPVSSPIKAIVQVRKHHFDVWIDFGPWPRINALFSYFSKARYTLGFKTPGQYRHYIYDRAILHSTKRHEINNYRTLIKEIGVKKHGFPHVNLQERVASKRRIACHLFPGGSQAALKMWPQAKWIELIDRLLKIGYEVVLTGGPNDKIELKRDHLIKLYGRLSLKETAICLTSCQHVISVDTGIMHLAAALGCHVISLHGPTSPKRWGAVGENVTVIKQSKSYTPCINFGYESNCKIGRCMQAITVDQVMEAVNESVYFSGRERDEAMALLTDELS